MPFFFPIPHYLIREAGLLIEFSTNKSVDNVEIKMSKTRSYSGVMRCKSTNSTTFPHLECWKC